MKRHLITTLILLLAGSAVTFAQENDALERFKKERTGQFDKYAADREEEFRKFKERYESAFQQFKRSYIGFLEEEEDFVDLMASDDGIQPIPVKTVPQVTDLSVFDLKQQLQEEIVKTEAMTPEELVPALSQAEDSVVQMQEAAEIMEAVVQEMNAETSEVETVSTPVRTEVVLDPPQTSIAPTNEVKAQGLDADFLAMLKADAQQEQTQAAAPVSRTSSASSVSVESSVPHGTPTQYVRISSPFGTRIHPITRKRQTHKGVDMAAPKMTPIYASADGKVTFANYKGSYGNLVKINHGNGYKTAYAHMHKIAVQNGDEVRKGDLIGYVGTTGRSTGNHLHYEVYYNDKLIDPATTL